MAYKNHLGQRLSLVLRRQTALITVACVAVAFGVAGSYLVYSSKAATPTADIEAEDGIVSSEASEVSDSSASGAGAVKFGVSNGMTLMWNDEFNGSNIDSTKWNVRTGPNGYDEAYNQPANVAETGGNMVITAKREVVNGKPYTAGYLDTIGKKGFRYGKFEMRAKLPVAQGISRGLWPAFWLRSDDSTGEIDIMEAWGDPGIQTGIPSEDPFGRVQGSAFKNTNDASQGKTNGWSGAVGSLDLTQWHTYSLVWNASSVTYYVDNSAFRTITTAAYPWLDTSFPTTANIRLNLQVSNTYYGLVDSSTQMPADMVVDYVRVYQ